jgi:hypothetical protein
MTTAVTVQQQAVLSTYLRHSTTMDFIWGGKGRVTNLIIHEGVAAAINSHNARYNTRVSLIEHRWTGDIQTETRGNTFISKADADLPPRYSRI